MRLPSLDSSGNGRDVPTAAGDRGRRVGGVSTVVSDAPVEALFAGSNGRYYTDWELSRKRQVGAWRPCIRQRDPDRRLVEIEDGSLLLLVPIRPEDLPAWAELRVDGQRARVVDTRRSVRA